MPLAPPPIDNRRYQQLVDELLARVPVHTPEWTNFNHSDPGVTLVQLFAFLTENLLYRANLVPERNAVKFLQLLRLPLATASAAQGLATINNDKGPLTTATLSHGLEVRAGNLPFRTELGLDVLPVEAKVFFKRPLRAVSAELQEYYSLLYASYQKPMPELSLYETVALDRAVVDAVDLHTDTVDRSLWIALLGRKDDRGDPADPWKSVRSAIAHRTLNLGLVPALGVDQTRKTPGGSASASGSLVFELPAIPANGQIPRDAADQPAPTYRPLAPLTDTDLLAAPGVAQLSLPGAAALRAWEGLDPLEAGVGDLPPTLEDSALSDRLITWLRVRAPGAAQARVLWCGINATSISQREGIIAEWLADGDGTPDQIRRLSRAPVLADSIEVITQAGAEQLLWTEIDDLMAALPEVPVADPRNPPVAPAQPLTPEQEAARLRWVNVFQADHEAGVLTFGDGLRGRRLPLDAAVFASYEYCAGAAGNVARDAINSAPQLPSGFSVNNPVATWGGADAETAAEGQKHIKRFLQHRDRLVSVEDFEAIAWRTPGIDLGRVEVLPAFHPDLAPNEPGSAPGAVTLLAIPRFDPGQPDAPRADRLFLDAICRYLEPRRLVTTELLVRGPGYKPIWISIGVDVAAGYSVAEVTEAVKARLRAFLAPVPPVGYAAQSGLLFGERPPPETRGWPLSRSVQDRVLLAEAARVAGVLAVNPQVLLAEGSGEAKPEVPITGLELPRILGISVVTGEPVSLAALRGEAATGTASGPAGTTLLPVPVIPETC
jgi:hypothetical protein